MLSLRVVSILFVIAIGAGIVLYLPTGDRKYVKFAQKLAQWAVFFALIVFALMVFERLAALS